MAPIVAGRGSWDSVHSDMVSFGSELLWSKVLALAAVVSKCVAKG